MASHVTVEEDASSSDCEEIEVKSEPVSSADESDGDEFGNDAELNDRLSGDDEGSDSSEEDEKDNDGNKGMAAVISKILTKKSYENLNIMSKGLTEKAEAAKKRKVEQIKTDNMEVVTADGVKIEPSENKPDAQLNKIKKKKLSTSLSQQMQKIRDNIGRVKPDPLDRNIERDLLRIATRGVVQLFNAVRQQQKDIDDQIEEVGRSVRKTDKVLEAVNTGDFLDSLKTQKVKTVSSKYKKEIKSDVKDEPVQDFLRDDYMMSSSTIKDWDKQTNELATD